MTFSISDYSRKSHPQVDWDAFQIVGETLAPLGFADHTWHNDLCAKLLLELSNNGDDYLAVWIDAKDPEDREDVNMQPFAISVELDGDQFNAEYADMYAAMDDVVVFAAAYHADLDEACALIQKYVGQTDGGIAGMFFTGSPAEQYAKTDKWQDRIGVLRDYLKIERVYAA